MKKQAILIAAITALLYGCGGGGESNDDPSSHGDLSKYLGAWKSPACVQDGQGSYHFDLNLTTISGKQVLGSATASVWSNPTCNGTAQVGSVPFAISVNASTKDGDDITVVENGEQFHATAAFSNNYKSVRIADLTFTK